MVHDVFNSRKRTKLSGNSTLFAGVNQPNKRTASKRRSNGEIPHVFSSSAHAFGGQKKAFTTGRTVLLKDNFHNL